MSENSNFFFEVYIIVHDVVYLFTEIIEFLSTYVYFFF